MRRIADALLALTAASIPLSTTGMEGGVLGLGGLTLLAAARGTAVVGRTPLDGVLAIFYATLALSTVASGHPLEATGWLRLWVVLTFFVVAWWVRDRRHAVRLAGIVALAGAVAAGYGVLQHFTGIDWYRALLRRPLRVAARTPEATGFAVVGFFRNYLTFAHVMVFPFAWTAAMALGGRWPAAAAAGLVLLAILFSTARGAWLAALTVVAALAAAVRGRRAAALLAGLALLATAVLLASPDLRGEVQGMFGLGGANAPRVAIYRANLDIVHAHPVLGLGFGRYATAAAPYYRLHPTADRRSHAHSNYLQLAAEAGLAGLAAFVLLLAAGLRLGWRALAGAADPATRAAAAGAWAGVAGFVVGGLTQYTFGDNEVAVAFWFALGLLVRLAAAEE
ncbi:MAG TPA: O-antigen ligase family protein [Candidatus Binatia bacterium]|nr:O-antigen ligase family protein [Candidatus Binatia bacterium]